ncbi:hypothetical protein [Solwaraspora sp. WMMD792]|nr:hypothetical protein [Solwaraspora sp. WMMD792]MDG4769466.1 hypothetical protein [Solwaraspora sp. WMMD792]
MISSRPGTGRVRGTSRSARKQCGRYGVRLVPDVLSRAAGQFFVALRHA